MVRRFVIFLVSLSTLSIAALSQDKDPSPELLRMLAASEKRIAACDLKFEEEYVARFGKKPLKVSLHSGPGSPVRLVKPAYTQKAKELRVQSEIVVEAIVSEVGKVLHASVKTGHPLLSRAALDATYRAEFNPIVACDGQPVLFRRRVRYLFHP